MTNHLFLNWRAFAWFVCASFLALFVHRAPASTFTPDEFRAFRSAVTQNGQLTGSLKLQEYRSAGELFGCGVVFQVVFRDWAYTPDGITMATGSITYFAKPDEAAYMATKLSIDDFRENDGQVKISPARAEYSYLKTDDISLAGKEDKMIFSQDSNSLLAAYPDNDLTLAGIFAQGPIDFAFNRSESGTDVHFAVDPTEAALAAELRPCMIELIQEMSER